MNTTTQLVTASVHLFYTTLDEAKREAYRLGAPYFRTYINGEVMWTVRVKFN